MGVELEISCEISLQDPNSKPLPAHANYPYWFDYTISYHDNSNAGGIYANIMVDNLRDIVAFSPFFWMSRKSFPEALQERPPTLDERTKSATSLHMQIMDFEARSAGIKRGLYTILDLSELREMPSHSNVVRVAFNSQLDMFRFHDIYSRISSSWCPEAANGPFDGHLADVVPLRNDVEIQAPTPRFSALTLASGKTNQVAPTGADRPKAANMMHFTPRPKHRPLATVLAFQGK